MSLLCERLLWRAHLQSRQSTSRRCHGFASHGLVDFPAAAACPALPPHQSAARHTHAHLSTASSLLAPASLCLCSNTGAAAMADLAAEMARFEAELAGVGDGGAFGGAPPSGGPGPQPGQLPPPPGQFPFNEPPPGSSPYGGVRTRQGTTGSPVASPPLPPVLSALSPLAEPLLLPAGSWQFPACRGTCSGEGTATWGADAGSRVTS